MFCGADTVCQASQHERLAIDVGAYCVMHLLLQRTKAAVQQATGLSPVSTAVALLLVASLVGYQDAIVRNVEFTDLPEVFDCHAAGHCHELSFGFEIATRASCTSMHPLLVKSIPERGHEVWRTVRTYNDRRCHASNATGQACNGKANGPCGWKARYHLEYNYIYGEIFAIGSFFILYTHSTHSHTHTHTHTEFPTPARPVGRCKGMERKKRKKLHTWIMHKAYINTK